MELTEHRLIHGLVVYGFLRMAATAAARHRALSEVLAQYCTQHELTLCGVFTERESASAAKSAAFAGLLDVLALPDTFGVVMPAASHLGPRAIAGERKMQIRAARARLLLIRHPMTVRAGLSDLVAQPAPASKRVRNSLNGAADASAGGRSDNTR
ncbi:hypothetical protein P3T37_004555 [Kitasatospora sp. MAA4]|uniref:hypothetical protein n=1 Tax=Kitasatospora sp. MAA4 TaxID=3035093 RepID=UPI0024735385|nr:hypothetical protein [Kitasatospora sp. MAA4]MDH6135145.1 hypothetical protein [Kitasatospora sp. MAA4]